VSFFQKRHGGFDVLAEALKDHGIPFTRRPRRTRPTQETLAILKGGSDAFRALVCPRYPLKAARLGNTGSPIR
jgi:hypothetical protein